MKFIESHQCSVPNFYFMSLFLDASAIKLFLEERLKPGATPNSETKKPLCIRHRWEIRSSKKTSHGTSVSSQICSFYTQQRAQSLNIPPFSSRCVFSLHTRLGRSQRRQRETLQDPQARQRGILHHHASTVWHLTEACQTLHRYAGCDASRSLLAPSLFIAVFHHTWKLLSVAPAALCHRKCYQGRWIGYNFNNNWAVMISKLLPSSAASRLRRG